MSWCRKKARPKAMTINSQPLERGGGEVASADSVQPTPGELRLGWVGCWRALSDKRVIRCVACRSFTL